MIDKLQNKIRELVPELMEASNGCVVSFERYESWTGECGDIKFSEDPTDGCESQMVNEFVTGYNADIELELKDFVNGIWTEGVDDNGGIDVWDYCKAEIIGHPIHLEHIVQSIIAKKHETRSAVFYVLIGEISCLYKYNKPFTEQSPELYELLSDILIKE